MGTCWFCWGFRVERGKNKLGCQVILRKHAIHVEWCLSCVVFVLVIIRPWFRRTACHKCLSHQWGWLAKRRAHWIILRFQARNRCFTYNTAAFFSLCSKFSIHENCYTRFQYCTYLLCVPCPKESSNFQLLFTFQPNMLTVLNVLAIIFPPVTVNVGAFVTNVNISIFQWSILHLIFPHFDFLQHCWQHWDDIEYFG